MFTVNMDLNDNPVNKDTDIAENTVDEKETVVEEPAPEKEVDNPPLMQLPEPTSTEDDPDIEDQIVTTVNNGIGVVRAVKQFWIGIKTGLVPALVKADWLAIPTSTYARWILAIIVTLNTILSYFGINPIPYSQDKVYMAVSTILNGIILIVNTYKNNSTSKEALLTDKLMTALKSAGNIDAKKNAIENINMILEDLNNS
jgi:SPP1 family holin